MQHRHRQKPSQSHSPGRLKFGTSVGCGISSLIPDVKSRQPEHQKYREQHCLQRPCPRLQASASKAGFRIPSPDENCMPVNEWLQGYWAQLSGNMLHAESLQLRFSKTAVGRIIRHTLQWSLFCEPNNLQSQQPHNLVRQEVLLLSPLDKGGTCGSERFKDLPKVTHECAWKTGSVPLELLFLSTSVYSITLLMWQRLVLLLATPHLGFVLSFRSIWEIACQGGS